MMKNLEINHITLSCNDLDRSFNFYKDVLGFKPLMKWQRGAYFLAGDIWFCLSLNKQPINLEHTDYRHIAFSVDKNEFENIKSFLITKNVIEWSHNTSEGDSFYFLDPDGHHLEIHVGDWQSRLKSVTDQHWEGGVEFF